MNKEFFKQINNKEAAYYLGLFIADGNLYRRKDRPATYRIQFKQKEEDNKILYHLHDLLDTNTTIRHECDGCRLIFSCQEMAFDLLRIGITENKSKTAKLPLNHVPKNLWSHLLRGYLDGDGYISKNRNVIGFVSASEYLLLQLHYILLELNIPHNSRMIRKSDNTGEIWVTTSGYLQLGEYLYKDKEDFFFDRKYNIYKEHSMLIPR